MVEGRPIERVRGTQDYWQAESRELDAVCRRLEGEFRAFGYQRIDVPVLELAELHLRKSGLDIISKLYSFSDQGGRQLCLRPELTASVVRAVVTQPAARLPLKVFSSGPVFRYERPSKGRYRQFVQSGCELIGAEGAAADAEAIFLAMRALDTLGLAEYRVTLGHVGLLGRLLASLGLTGRLRTFLLESLEESRRHGVAGVRERLRELDPELFEPAETPIIAEIDEGQARTAIAGMLSVLGAEALGRRNQADVVERMLRKLRPSSGKEAVDRALGFLERLSELHGSPTQVIAAGRAVLREYGLEDAPLNELEATISLLDAYGASHERLQLDLGLSRGLQYYTGMVFEIDHHGLGSESQLCGGGRYDDLVRSLGGRQSIPALGFAFGVERVRLALAAEGKSAPVEGGAEVLVAPSSTAQQGYAGRAAQALRGAGYRVSLDVSQRPLKASLTYADREGFSYVAVIGETEQRDGTVRLRDMRDGAERVLPLSEIEPAATNANGSTPASSRGPGRASKPRAPTAKGAR